MEINELIDKRQNLENMLKEVNKDIEKETTKTKPKQYNVNFVIGVNCSMTVLAHSKELAKEIIDEFVEDVQF